MAYCTQADVYAYGLPPGSLANPGRLVASVDLATSTLHLGEHGFTAGDPVEFRAEGCGALPEPLQAGVTYYVSPTSPNAFALKAAPNDTVDLPLYTEGGEFLAIAQIPWTKALDWGAAIVDSYLPAHVVPLSPPFPPRVVHWNATLTAAKLLAWTGSVSVDLNAALDQARSDLKEFARGMPLRGLNSPERTNLAASASSATRDPRGWRKGGLL